MKIINRTIGDTIIPSKIPNFDHRRLGILNTDGFTKENTKKNIDKIKKKIEKVNCVFV